MGTKCVVGIAVMILVAAGSAVSQQNPYPVPAPQTAPVPQGVGPQGSPPYAEPPVTYQRPGLPDGRGYRQPARQGPTSRAQWPTYPYPQYHNPYYQGADPRAALTGTIDWLFSLPAVVMDRFSNVVDKNFFPRQPATSGGPVTAPPHNPPMNQPGRTPPNALPQAGTIQESGVH